jgi:hypothetical protein
MGARRESSQAPWQSPLAACTCACVIYMLGCTVDTVSGCILKDTALSSGGYWAALRRIQRCIEEDTRLHYGS